MTRSLRSLAPMRLFCTVPADDLTDDALIPAMSAASPLQCMARLLRISSIPLHSITGK